MRVLVVEDDPKFAAAVARGLRLESYAVDQVSDGDAALQHAAVYDYDAMVLDVMLPMRDGFDVCRTLRERGCAVPVLMLTARGQVADRIHGLDAGADDYLAKPFDFMELLARVRALVRRGPARDSPRLTAGDLVVDTATHQVRRAGQLVELTAREFAVLEYLARHAGEVVTRAELLDHVWDANFEGSTNIVDVYVASLRRKLEQPFNRALIQTLRGVGFKLESQP